MALDLHRIKQIITSGTNSEPTMLYLYRNMQDPECENLTVMAVNNLLESGKTRLKGLEFLKDLILYCSSDVFARNVLYWSSHCLVQHAEDSGKAVKLNTLAKIIENSNGLDLFNKKFSTEYLSTTFKACLVSHHNDEKLACLKCLSQCLRRYSSWFGNHKPKVEAFLVECLDSSSEDITKQAALGFLYFLEAGGAGVNGINHINNFDFQFKKLCSTIQKLYDTFFDGVGEINNSTNVGVEEFQLKQLTDRNKIFEVTARRIINCLIFIETLIGKQFCAEKRIVPKFVVDIICRGLSVHICFSKVHISDDESNRCVFLRNIQQRLLILLRIFVIGYQPNLIPFSYILKKTLASSAKRFYSCNCFTYDLSFKRNVYKTLVTWLTLNKNVDEKYLQDSVIPILLKDISPSQKNILLNLDLKQTKSKFAQDLKVAENNNSEKMPRNEKYFKSSSCVKALEVLTYFLKESYFLHNQIMLKEIIFTLLKIIFDIQIGKVVVPYTENKCQTGLYKALIAILSQEGVETLPSLHLMINVLKTGMTSLNQEISQASREGLGLLEKISQPVCSTLCISDSLNSRVQLQVDSNDLLNLESNADVVMTYDVDNGDIIGENENVEDEKKINVISNIIISMPSDFNKKDVVMDENKDNSEVANETVSLSSSDDLLEADPQPILVRSEECADEDMFNTFKDVVQE